MSDKATPEPVPPVVVGVVTTTGTRIQRQTFVVCSFAELPLEFKDLIINEKTGISESDADEHLEVVLSILRYKTGLYSIFLHSFSKQEGSQFSFHPVGHNFLSPLTVDKPNITKKFNYGPSLIDQEITATRDLVSESDALVCCLFDLDLIAHKKRLQPRLPKDIITSSRPLDRDVLIWWGHLVIMSSLPWNVFPILLKMSNNKERTSDKFGCWNM